jgi:SLT domain-containing protein
VTDLTFNIVALGDAFTKMIALGDSVEKLGIKLDELDRKKADPKISLDTTEANAKIDELKAKLDSVSNGGGSGGGIGKGSLIGGALALGAGPIVGAGLLAIPAAILAIGVAAEHTNPQVVAAFGNLTAAAKQTAQQGFSPLVPSLVQFANEAQGALGSVQGNLTDSAQAAAPLLNIIGSGFIRATQQGIGAAVPIVQGLRPIAQALGDDLVKAEQGAMGFLGKLQPGPAAQGLAELGTAVQEVLPPIGQLVNDVVPLGNDLMSVAVPALTNTAGAAHLLAVPLQAAGSVVSFLGPAIGAAVPPVLALAAGARLLTGSWTDFSGAGAKLIAPLQNINGTLTGLGNKIGITTAAQNAENKVTVEAALVRAQLAKQTAEATALEAAFAAEQVGTAEAELAAVAAADELAAADAALVEAEAAAAGAAEGLTFSLGPIGLVLGVAAAGAAAFAMGSNTASSAAKDLSQQIIQLGNDAPAAAAGLVSSSADLQQISGDLNTVGSSAQAFAHAYSGSLEVAQQYTDALKSQQDVLGSQHTSLTQTIVDSETGNAATATQTYSIKELSDAVNSHAVAMSDLSPAQQQAVRNYQAFGPVVDQAGHALTNLKAAQQAESQMLVQEGIVLSAAARGWNAYGLAIGQRGTDFNSATAGIKSVTDNLLGANSAFFGAQANFAQLDAAVVSADQAYQQSAAGVANAQHALGQASQGVTQARQGEQQAVLGVTNAQDQLTKADQAEQQSQVGLTLARQQAAQALKDLQRQVIDQGDTEAEAQLRLLDAQNAVNAAGLGGKTLAGLGGPTTANEANYKLLLTLQEAQHNLNDVTAQGQQLGAQNAAAQAAGVDGSQQVIAAQQQVTQAQQQAKQAAQALQQAQQGVAQASQAVANAQWGEQQASAAVKQASQAQHTAALALTQAKADDSRGTDINSAAGLRNSQTIEQLFEANFKATGDINQATTATEIQGQQMGITKGAVDGVITSLTKVPATTPFAIVGTPSLNLTALVQQASAQGISPFSLGLPHGDVQFAIDTAHGKASGGLIQGPGTGTSDSIVAFGSGGPLRVSNGEYIVKASETAKHLPLLTAINSGAVPGFAAGGQVDAKSLMGVNYRLAGWDGFLQGTSSILQTFGIRAPNLPAGNGSVDFGGLGVQLSTSLGGQIAYNRPGGVTQWAPTILQALAMIGQSSAWLGTVERRMNQESGGNPTIVNRWDSNWAAGTPSVGLMQVIGPTFRGNAGPFLNTGPFEYGVSVNPLANTYSGLHYAMGRYHTLDALNRPGGYRDGGIVDALRAPKVRDNGGPIDPGWNMIYNGTGRAENSRSGAQEDALLAELRAMHKDMKNLQSVSVAAPPGSSASEVADMVMRRLNFHGRW